MKMKNVLDDNQSSREDEPKQVKLEIQYFQPWSNFVCRLKLPDEIFKMLEKLYEDASRLGVSFGKELVGQVVDEPQVTYDLMQKHENFIIFCNESIRNFVSIHLNQTLVGDTGDKNISWLQEQKFHTRINTMWFVNQKPNEYNPIHIHTNCKVSSVMYLQTPKKQIESRKSHHDTDGMITFTNNTGTDYRFSNSQLSLKPVAGDMYIFPAMQNHMVWPYRSQDPNDSRISLSFNADYVTEDGLEKEKEQQEKMYEEMKKMKESKNDKSIDASNINKSG